MLKNKDNTVNQICWSIDSIQLIILFCSQTEHPFEAEREYTRALNSVKLEKVFAKPFLGALDGHRHAGFHQLLHNFSSFFRPKMSLQSGITQMLSENLRVGMASPACVSIRPTFPLWPVPQLTEKWEYGSSAPGTALSVSLTTSFVDPEWFIQDPAMNF